MNEHENPPLRKEILDAANNVISVTRRVPTDKELKEFKVYKNVNGEFRELKV